MLKKIDTWIMVFAMLPAWVAFADKQSNQKQPVVDFSGNWELQSKGGSQVRQPITLVILQVGPEIRITERVTSTGSTREFTYYTDSRGETNPSSDGKKILKSVSRWKDRKLITRYELPSTRSDNNPVVNERVDEWSISSDGQTLTQTSTLKRSAQQDASVNPYGSPRASTVTATPLNWQEKRSFKRVQ